MDKPQQSAPEKLTIPIRWLEDQPPALAANTILVSRSQYDEVIILFGHVAPPVVGTPEEQFGQAKELAKSGMSVKTEAKIVLSMGAARNLQTFLENQIGPREAKE